MSIAPVTSWPADDRWYLDDLDDLARELAGWGWVVRFEPQCFLPGTRGGHLVLTRPRSGTVEHVLALRRRHEIHVWTRTGEDTWPLGSAVGVGEVQQLLRQEARRSGAAGWSPRAGAGLAA